MKRLLKILMLLPIILLAKIPAENLPSPVSDFHFTENKGQLISSVKYHCKLHVGDMFLTNNQFIFDLFSAPELEKLHAIRHGYLEDTSSNSVFNKHIYNMTFLGANTENIIMPSKELPFKKNYFRGNNSDYWSSDASSYQSLTYKNIYNGIDINIYTKDNHLKYDYIVSNYANPDDIIVLYEGVRTLRVVEENLEVILSNGLVKELAPFAYQFYQGEQVEVLCEFHIDNNRVSFSFPNGYDESKDLIIDPTLVFSTFTGSSSDNWGFTSTYDTDGNFYAGSIVLGGSLGFGSFSNSANYPITGGAYQVNFEGFVDVAISKFNSTGTTLLYSTYLGGSEMEEPHSLICDDQNNLILIGATSSTNFPVTSGAFQGTYGGGSYISSLDGINWNNGSDIFITKLNSTGSSLIGSTFIGGTSNDGLALDASLNFNYADHARGEVMLDNNDNIYIASSSESPNFPTTASSHSQSLSGNIDGVICKLSSNLDMLIWSTYVGGSSADAAYSIRVDTVNNQTVICGGTTSSNIGSTFGTINTTSPGGIDGYVATFSNTTGSLNALTYLGTSSYDQSYIVEIDKNGDIYVVGQTNGNYPVSAGVYSNSGANQFIHKINSTLTTTDFSTVFGSVNSSSVNISLTAFLVDNCDNIYVAGWGGGNTYNMPITTNAIQSTTDGNDFYFIVLDRDAQNLLYGTYFGGTGGYGEHVDGGTSRFDKEGVIYQAVCAGCSGGSFPTSPGVYSPSNGSSNCNYGGIKIDFEAVGVMAFASANPTATGCAPLTVNFSNSSTANSYLWDFDDNNQTSIVVNPIHIFNNPGVYNVMLTAVDSSTCNISDTIILPIVVQNAIPSSISNDTVCNDYLWNGTLYTTSGTYTYTIPVSTGCDSTAILNLIIADSTSATISDAACDSYIWSVDGNIYSSSGVYTSISTNSAGCVHIDTLNLMITDSTTTAMIDTSCNLYTWSVDGNTYSSSGVYTSISTNSAGCVHTDSLTLTINTSTSNTISESACDSYIWSVDGNTYSSSGIYTSISTNSAGCVHTDSLTLTINTSTSNTISDVACDSYIWSVDSNTYSSSGVYTSISTNSAGCVHTDSLTLTINTSINTVDSVDTCEDSFIWNGQSYFASGTYTNSFTNILGCDSIVNLVLSFLNKPVANFTYQQENLCDATLSFSNTSTNFITSFWDFGDDSYSYETDPTHIYYSPNEYITTLFILNNGIGCIDSISYVVDYINENINLLVPNTFTPNGDEHNEVFKPVPYFISEEGYSFSIYNRWGELIFYSDDVDQGWNGFYKGEICQDGIYTWKLNYFCGEYSPIKFGVVTLIR